MTILIYGDPVSGWSFVGPFDDSEKAIAYADEFLNHTTWWMTELENPEVDNE